MNQKPMVSVVMITYGHENYIRQAIEGVLMQNCDFGVELIVANDCSPDTTDDIIKDIIQNHPRGNWIKYHHHEKNLGMMPNFIFALEQAKGKYIALCEGDDYWTDPLKLKKQVEFLEKNPDYILCHSNVQILKKSGELISGISIKKWNQKVDVLDYRFAIFNSIAFTCTAVYRNNFTIKKKKYKIVAGDWMHWILLTLKGKAKFLNEITAVYRDGVGVSANVIWQDNFNENSRFLFNLISTKNTITQNYWLLNGALFFRIAYIHHIYKIRFIYRIAKKLIYQLDENGK